MLYASVEIVRVDALRAKEASPHVAALPDLAHDERPSFGIELADASRKLLQRDIDRALYVAACELDVLPDIDDLQCVQLLVCRLRLHPSRIRLGSIHVWRSLRKGGRAAACG